MANFEIALKLNPNLMDVFNSIISIYYSQKQLMLHELTFCLEASIVYNILYRKGANYASIITLYR